MSALGVLTYLVLLCGLIQIRDNEKNLSSS